MNDSKLRKYEYTMVISGAGVIAFGVWSVIKAVIVVISNSLGIFGEFYSEKDMMQLNELGITEQGASLLVAVIVFLLLIIDLLMRLYIGLRAVAEARRLRKTRSAYIVLAVIMGLFLLIGLILRPFQYAQGTYEDDILDSAFASGIADMTSLLAITELVISAVMVRRLRKKAGRQETESE